MHVLTVIDHPKSTSFTHAIAERFGEGAREAGHTTETADLHAEGFNPAWSLLDIDVGETQPAPEGVLAEQARIERCDALALVFPLFWWGMPAMLKGWVDRVWTYGWAYDDVDDPNRSLQPARSCVMLVPCGASPQSMAPHGYPGAMSKIWDTGTLGYFGMTDTQIHLLHGSHGSDERRSGLLDTTFRAGRDLKPPS